jgi:hypothetical protein
MKLFVLVILLIITGCSDNNTAMFLPTAIEFRDALKQSEVWAEVIHYTYEDIDTKKIYKHAVVAFKYPSNNPYMRLYDKAGSRKILDFHYSKNIKAFARDLAQLSETTKKNHRHNVIEAEVVK